MTEPLADHKHHSNDMPTKMYGLDSVAFGVAKEPTAKEKKQSQRNVPKELRDPELSAPAEKKKRKKKWQVRKDKMKEEKLAKRKANSGGGQRKRIKLDPEEKFVQTVVNWLEGRLEKNKEAEEWVDIAHIGDKCARPKGFPKSWKLGLFLSKQKRFLQVDGTGKNVRLIG
jgi:hypothetical protein